MFNCNPRIDTATLPAGWGYPSRSLICNFWLVIFSCPFWSPKGQNRSELFFCHFLTKFMLFDHKTCFTGISEVLLGVCKPWATGAIFEGFWPFSEKKFYRYIADFQVYVNHGGTTFRTEYNHAQDKRPFRTKFAQDIPWKMLDRFWWLETHIKAHWP